MLKNAFHVSTLLLLLLLAAGSAGGQDDSRASEPSDEQVEHWLATLRAFEVPQPGPISSETARLKREILRAPLEQMPPPVRAGYILCQVAIYDADGDWDGFVALRRRVTDPETWVYAPEDNLPLRDIASYYDHIIFSPPGGLSGNSSDQYSSAYWDNHYRSKADYIEVMEYAIERADPTDATAVDMSYLLANEIKQTQPDRAEALLKELDAIPLESLTAAPIYDRRGLRLYEAWIVKTNAGRIDSMRDYLSGEMDRRIKEAARAQRADLERRREQGEEIPVEPNPLAFPNSPTTSVRPSGYPVPTAVQDQTSTGPAAESPGDAGGRTRLWLLLGGVLAAAAVGGGLLVWWRRRGAAAG
ncbi:MAG: hypothetical protein PWP23_230 [Candidatus Sumerlaeota bacterium]|nr:hypothetical protein [Candidatus Sumerlaeota bacterium]